MTSFYLGAANNTMKTLIGKFFANTSRFEFFLLVIPFVCWIFCFRYFFTGHLQLEADAISYADHIGFYTDNLSRGVFPLWDPAWFNGVPYHFFLRRIGEVNPFLLLIVVLKWFGVSSANSYLIFLGIYYFLAGWAFYLIARFLLADRFYAFTAYILFLFSSWGSEVFYNYIVIIFVPIIWFFYFLLRFARESKKAYFLGMCFCTGLIVTTYIPFFFLIILTIFVFLYILFYGEVFINFLKRSFSFFYKNKVFTVFCMLFLLICCVPALIFYKESKSGEFVLPDRHSGADTSSAVAVGLNTVASGDIISHGYFDRIFDDHADIDMGDIYIPYMFFLLLLTTACGRVNKLIFFLLFNIMGLSLITITSAAGVHRFLYEHIILFKFIRNIYYFFWLAMLPMVILLSVAAFKSLLTAIHGSSKKTAWLVYIIVCHLLFIAFLCGHQGVLWGAWAAIVISLFYFLVLFRYDHKISYPVGFCAILLAVFIQSAQVYGFLDKKLFQTQQKTIDFESTHQDQKIQKLDLYYTTTWFAYLVKYIDPQVLEDYRKHPFIFYENVIPYRDSPEAFNALQTAMASNLNIAFLSSAESKPGDWLSNPQASQQADTDPIASGKLTVLHADANTWKFKAHLPISQFLVVNDNYNSHWHAFINGQPVHLFRANASFKGLWVPSGESNIVLRFSSPKRYIFHISLIILFAGTFLYLLVLLKKEAKQPEFMDG
jgi:hypothetical protein